MRLRVIIFLVVILIIIGAGAGAVIFAFNHVEIDSVHEAPGFQDLLVTKLKKTLIARSSRQVVLPVGPGPADVQASIKAGETLYGTDCSMCHGMDGRGSTDNGRWMYPRAADLTSSAVQEYSGPELFWIIKNGIRFTGMPAFGKVETDANILNLVNYLRALPNKQEEKKEGDGK